MCKRKWITKREAVLDEMKREKRLGKRETVVKEVKREIQITEMKRKTARKKVI